MGLFSFIFGPKKRSQREAYEHAAQTIEDFVEGRSGPWDWDDFISVPKEDEYLEDVSIRCNGVSDDFPPRCKEDGYCSAEGYDVLLSIAKEVRERVQSMT